MKQILQIMLLLFCITMHAQDDGGKMQTANSSNLTLGINEIKTINGRFESLNSNVIHQISSMKLQKNKALLLVKDNMYNYFLVNTSGLISEFEKIYFYKSVAKNNLSIQVEHGLPADVAWIITDLKKSSTVDGPTIEQLLNESTVVSSKMSVKEKSVWLSTN